MEDIAKSFNVQALNDLAQTADFGNDLEQNKQSQSSKQKQSSWFPPIVKTVCLVVAIVSVILILVYIIYQKWKKSQAPKEQTTDSDTTPPP